MNIKEKKCNKCLSIKPSGEFYVAKDTVDGLKGYCKQCYRDGDKKRNDEHKVRCYINFLKLRGYKITP